MTVTVFGTGTLHAVPEDGHLTLPNPVPGLVVTEQQHGFSAEMTASLEAFSAVRALTRSVPTAYGFAHELGDSAELVVSELLGNVVRASPETEPVPLIVEVHVVGLGVEVIVHDAVPGAPNRRDVALDSAEAMSGRGLHLLDLLTTRWTSEPSPLGKKIRCYLTAE
ncbi:ATP-binding protein [Streptomyces sp. MNU76]|uniref:ATP-binding protein n=1 Tax=Streptomyces sp. MNU76 TaxID=2560026 RepID=UPI001E3BAFF7|nr:ATP-binding protein [Streptomyces sp. MNU76]MCC9707284.1 ATP-binding protein [Streptomyces sp. MNU76]